MISGSRQRFKATQKPSYTLGVSLAPSSFATKGSKTDSAEYSVCASKSVLEKNEYHSVGGASLGNALMTCPNEKKITPLSKVLNRIRYKGVRWLIATVVVVDGCLSKVEVTVEYFGSR